MLIIISFADISGIKEKRCLLIIKDNRYLDIQAKGHIHIYVNYFSVLKSIFEKLYKILKSKYYKDASFNA